MSFTRTARKKYEKGKRERGLCRICSNPGRLRPDGTRSQDCEYHLALDAKNRRVNRAKKKAAGIAQVKVAVRGPMTKADEAREWFMACRRRIAIAA